MVRIAPVKPRLDVRDLELVLAIARGGSTVKAASSLHVTQSAVSRGLLLAEDKLGVRLFERTARGLVPTAAGERLTNGAFPLLEQLVELERQVEAPRAAPVRIRIACECYTAYRWLPSTLATLRRSVPDLDVRLAVEHTRAPVAALVGHEIDVAFLTTSTTRAPIVERPLMSDEIVFVVSRQHPLATRPFLTPRDLEAHPMIVSSLVPPAAATWFHGAVFGRAKPKLQYVPLPLTEAMIDGARAGMGVAVLSEWILNPYLETGDLVIKRLKTKKLQRPWRVAYRPEAKEHALRLAAAVERAPFVTAAARAVESGPLATSTRRAARLG